MISKSVSAHFPRHPEYGISAKSDGGFVVVKILARVKHQTEHAKTVSFLPPKKKQIYITFLIFNVYTKHLPRHSGLPLNGNIHFSIRPLLNTHHSSIFAASYKNCGRVGTNYSKFFSQ